ncbi:MAG TPA: lysylphosphatidylglycerol synthase transmembrane domain-containing protein [Bryobacteraceae bacterium]|nr:lysylphosphatidylglycerol synthase transmembrane domain-containing protein [Bryobacteraceae bacterium]
MPESTELSTTPRPRAIYWVISLGLAAFLLYESLRGIEWLRVWQSLRGARPDIIVVVLSILSFTLFMRACRWRILLRAEGYVSVPLAFWATAAGYLGNNVLPARAGELVRTLMISGRSRMSKAYVLTTALSERVVDAIVLISISATVLLTLPHQPGWIAKAARPFALLGFIGVAGIVFLPLFESLWLRILRRLPIPYRFRGKVERMLGHGLQGIRSFHDRRRLGGFLALTALIWFLDGLTTVCGARAIGITISFPIAFLLVAGLGLGSALPSTPGYVGIYQFVAVSVLTPFGLSRTDAIAYILLFQALNYLVLLFWVLIGLDRQRKAPLRSVAQTTQ